MKIHKVIFGLIAIIVGFFVLYLFLLAWGMGNTPDKDVTCGFWSPKGIFELFMPWSGFLLGIALIYVGFNLLRGK